MCLPVKSESNMKNKNHFKNCDRFDYEPVKTFKFTVNMINM